MKVEDINVNNILLDETSHENILVYNIFPLSIRFDKVNRLYEIYNGIRYLELFDSYNEVYYRINCRIYNAIFNRINYLISKKVVLQIVLIIILQESELIHIILYL